MINILEIIKENNITEVWSDFHGKTCNIILGDHREYPIEVGGYYFTTWGSFELEFSESCLLWPSKEERTWKRFVKQDVYEPYTDILEFIKDFGGKWVRDKISACYFILDTVDLKSDSPKMWFENYTLLDGTPIGKKVNK